MRNLRENQNGHSSQPQRMSVEHRPSVLRSSDSHNAPAPRRKSTQGSVPSVGTSGVIPHSRRTNLVTSRRHTVRAVGGEFVVRRRSGARTGPDSAAANRSDPQILDPGRTDAVAGPSPSCGTIVSARIVLRSLADLAGLVVSSATPPTHRRTGERLRVRARSLRDGLRHERLPAPAWA